MIQRALGDGERFGLRLTYSHEPVILGTGGGIKQAEPHFNGEPVLVLNGDTLFELDLGALIAFHRERQAAATMVLRCDSDAAKWGLVEINGKGEVVRITGRGGASTEPTQPRMFAGVHILHPRLLRALPAGKESSIIDAYVRGIQDGERIVGYDFDGYWTDVGTPDRYAQVEHDAAAGLISLAARQPVHSS